KKIADLDLTPYVVFTGLRKDVPVIMLSVFDVFAFPSLWEGLGLVAVEAQLAGLSCLVSRTVPLEVNLGGIKYLDLDSAYEWSNEIDNLKFSGNITSYESYDIYFNAQKLNMIYEKN